MPGTALFVLRSVACNDGIAAHCEMLIRHLKHEAWDVVIISGPVFYDEACASRYRALKSLARRWIEVAELSSVPSTRTVWLLAKIIREERVSVVHLHGYSMLLSAKIAGAITRTPIVVTFHDSFEAIDPAQAASMAGKQGLERHRLLVRVVSPDRHIALSTEIFDLLADGLGSHPRRSS